jgi:radical SAM superfamily enzyme YgiQ (UPF0313 family)
MKITLVRPGSTDRRFLHETSWAWEAARSVFTSISRFKLGAGNDMPPLGLLVLATLTPPDCEVVLFDEEIEDIDFDAETDLVGITAMTITANRAYEIADEYRRRGVKVVLGGIHPTVMTAEAGRHADAVVVGEADELWPAVVRDARAGTLRPVYRQERHIEMTRVVAPRRDLLKSNLYLTTNLIQATRGCPNDCSFCSIHLMSGRRYRCRPVEQVIQEIETFSDPIVAFVDDNIVGNPSYAKELFRALIPLGVKWYGQGALNIADDPELLDLAARSGCTILLVGFESLSPDTIRDVGKSRTNRVDAYGAAIERLHDHGVAIQGSFILGLDRDDPTVFERTYAFIQSHAVDTPLANVLIPHPGTRLRAELESQGRIIHSDWDEYGRVFGRIAYQPRLMSIDQLRDGHLWLHERIWSLPASFSRTARAKSNYLANSVVGLKQWGATRRRMSAARTPVRSET